MHRPLSPEAADPIVIAGPESGLIAVDLTLAAAVFSISGGVALTGTLTAASVTVTGTLALTGAAALLTGNIGVSGTMLALGGGATLAAAGTLTLSGAATAQSGGLIEAAAVVLSAGTLALDSASAIAIGSPPIAGRIELAKGSTLAGAGAIESPLDDNGLLLVQGGPLSVQAAIAGAGAIAIGAGGTLYLPGGLPKVPVSFAGAAGTLELLTLAQHFAGPLTGFGPGDAIAFAEADVTGAVWQAGTLTVTAATGSLAVPLPGNFAGATFAAIPDGDGGSTVKLATASISGLTGGDITLGDGGNLIALTGTPQVAALTIDEQVVLAGAASVGTLTLAGTLLEQSGASLTVQDIAGFGLLAADGTASIAVADATALAATLDLTGGASASFATVDLAGGAFSLDAASRLVAGSGTGPPGTVLIAPGSLLSGYGRLPSPTLIQGTLEALGGVLVVAAPVNGRGSAAIASGATLDVFANIAPAVSFAPGATLLLNGTARTGTLTGFAAGSIIDITGAVVNAAVWSPGTLVLIEGRSQQRLSIAGNYAGQTWQAARDGGNGSLIQLLGSGAATFDLAGAQTIAGTVPAGAANIQPGGVLTLAGGTLAATSVGVAQGGIIAGQGTLDGAITANGVIAAAGGVLTADGAIGGTGTVEIAGNATFYAPLGIAAGASVVFTGSGGTLELFGPALDTRAVIGGLSAGPGRPDGNAIDIAAATVTSARYTALGNGNGSLSLTTAQGPPGSLALSGVIGAPSVLVLPDGAGGSLIELVPCFVAGTLIATPHGAVQVEHLRAGDIVETSTGPQRLRWTGRRTCDAMRAPELRPVRIPAGALGGGLPVRDLLLSPRHALWLHGALVPAVGLCGCGTIHRATAGPVRYHHLGLATHGLVFAEGVPAETWLPGPAPIRFDAETGIQPSPGPPCGRIADGGLRLEALRRRLGAPPRGTGPHGKLQGHVERIRHAGGRTVLEGWALDTATPDSTVLLHALHRGAPVLRVIANCWRPDLDRAGLGGGRCAFRAELPGTLDGVVLQRHGDGATLPGLAVEGPQAGPA